jgi:hypothetical protein
MLTKKCINKLDYSKILGSKGIKSIIPIETLATNIITNEVFLTDIYRNNLLNLIINAYNEGLQKYNLDRNYVYLIYKGGNIIESTMQNIVSSLENIKPDFFKRRNINIYEDIIETGLLNNKNLNELLFDTTIELNKFLKRSDIDLAVYIDYCQILKINKKSIKEQVDAIWSTEHKKYIETIKNVSNLITYILYVVRDNLDKSSDKPINKKLTKIPTKYLKETDEIFYDIKNKTNQILKKSNLSHNEYIYLHDENPFYIQQILYNKNLSNKFNKGFSKTDNTIKFIGIGYNGKNIDYINSSDKITGDNCISYSLLKKINESSDIQFKETIDSGIRDFEVKFCTSGNTAIINDSIFYNNFSYGSKIEGVENNKLIEINGSTMVDTNNENNNYYISSNYTTRISTRYVKNLHNLHRIKYNFRFYFGLPNSFITQNKEIKFFYINIAGEVLDIPTPLVGDFDLYFTISRKSKTLIDIPNFYGNLKSYSIYELIFNLCKIIFYQTNFRPWNDEKYGKRIVRLIELSIFNYLSDSINRNQVKKYSKSISSILNKLLLIKENNSKIYTKILYSYIKSMYSSPFKNVMKCIVFTIHKNIDDHENNSKFINVIINIFDKFIDFNLVNDI